MIPSSDKHSNILKLRFIESMPLQDGVKDFCFSIKLYIAHNCSSLHMKNVFYIHCETPCLSLYVVLSLNRIHFSYI